MKIRMLTTSLQEARSGKLDDAIVLRDGEVVDVANDVAKRLLESGQAEPVAEKPADRAEKRGPGRPRKAETAA